MSEGFNLRRIFVVDDERSVAMTLVRILRHGGYDATPFTDPYEALAAVRANPPALLLAEANMPSLSGADLGNEVRKHSLRCKVLLMSGTVTSLALAGTIRAGGLEFEVLEKPIHMATLLGKVQRVIGAAKPPQKARPLILKQSCA